MNAMAASFDPAQRAAAKQRSRERDDTALSSALDPKGLRIVRERLRSENGGSDNSTPFS